VEQPARRRPLPTAGGIQAAFISDGDSSVNSPLHAPPGTIHQRDQRQRADHLCWNRMPVAPWREDLHLNQTRRT
jgi:hypothetical protein